LSPDRHSKTAVNGLGVVSKVGYTRSEREIDGCETDGRVTKDLERELLGAIKIAKHMRAPAQKYRALDS